MIRAAPLALLVGCAIPVDVGALDDDTSATTTDATTTDATTTDATTSETLESSSSIGLESSSTGDTGGIVERRDLAFREGDLPPPDDGTTGAGSSVGTSGGSDIDPDALRIIIGIGETTCEDPYAPMPCDRWELEFSLPPDQQFVGASGPLFDNFGTWSERGPGSEDDCPGGFGTLEGTYEITGLDDAEVRGRLTDLGPVFDQIPTEIEFTALRCG